MLQNFIQFQSNSSLNLSLCYQLSELQGNNRVVNNDKITVIDKTLAFVFGELLYSTYKNTKELFSKLISNMASLVQGSVEINNFKNEIENCEEVIDNFEINRPVCKAFDLIPLPFNNCIIMPSLGSKKEILKIANKILNNTLNTIKYSTNNLPRSISTAEVKRYGGLVDKARNCLSLLRSKIFTDQLLLDSTEQLDNIRNHCSLSEKTKLGNCGEMSNCAFLTCMNMGIWDIPVELIHIENGDHAFVVIGRNPNTDINHFYEWGSNAIVIDAWAGKVFSTDLLESELNAYYGIYESTGQPILENYQRDKHRLGIAARNAYSSFADLKKRKEEFCEIKSDEVDKSIDSLLQNLEKFHSTKILQEKMIHAQNAIDICMDSIMREYENIAFIGEQMQYFLELSPEWLNKT